VMPPVPETFPMQQTVPVAPPSTAPAQGGKDEFVLPDFPEFREIK
jgi:hypothetical protein